VTLHGAGCELYIANEQVDIEVTLQIHIYEVLSLNLGQDIGYPKFFHGFLQFLLENIRIIPQLCHKHILPNPF
jgi:hypothetical protein